MLGFLFGTVCLALFAGLYHGGPGCHRGFHHRRRHPWGGGGWEGDEGPRRGRHGHRRHGRGGRGGGFQRAASEMFKRRLRVDEDQEDLVDHALRDLRDAMGGLTRELKRERADLAEAFAGETVDEAGLAALWAQQDEELQRFRREAISALKQIHAVLDPEQRKEAASWLQREGGWA